MEMSPSWSRAHDWKSCNRQKRFESSNLSFSASDKTLENVDLFNVFKGFSRFWRLMKSSKMCGFWCVLEYKLLYKCCQLFWLLARKTLRLVAASSKDFFRKSVYRSIVVDSCLWPRISCTLLTGTPHSKAIVAKL